MKDDDAGLPAWMLCNDLLIKVKNELANEAIIALEREMKAGRIDVRGSVIAQPDQQQDGENKLFVINNLITERDGIHERYDQYVKDFDENPSKFDGSAAERIEALKKFMLAVDEIYTFMHYSKVMADWADDASMRVRETDPSEILAKTASAARERAEAASFVLSLKSFIRENILSEGERRMLERAVQGGAGGRGQPLHN